MSQITSTGRVSEDTHDSGVTYIKTFASDSLPELKGKFGSWGHSLPGTTRVKHLRV